MNMNSKGCEAWLPMEMPYEPTLEDLIEKIIKYCFVLQMCLVKC